MLPQKAKFHPPPLSEECDLQPGPPPPASLPSTHHDGGWSLVKTPRGGAGCAAASPRAAVGVLGFAWPPTGEEEDGDVEQRTKPGQGRRSTEAWRAGVGAGGDLRDLAVWWASANERPRRALAGGAPRTHVALQVREGCHRACVRYGAPDRSARPRPHGCSDSRRGTP